VIEVRTAPLDGTNDRLLATLSAFAGFESDGSWSPDGKTIVIPAFQLKPEPKWVLNAIDANNGQVRALASTGDKNIGRPVWMPDGHALVVPVGKNASVALNQLWSVDYPSGEMRRFTNDLTDYTGVLDASRDGRMLAAIQISRASNVWILPGGNSEHARQMNGGQTPYRMFAAGTSGKAIALTVNGDLRLISTDSGESTALVPEAMSAGTLTTCGDRYVVFDRVREGKLEVWRADLNGSNPTKVLSNAFKADCSPDGKWIYFWPSGNKLYRVSLENGTPAEVMTVPTDIGAIVISPDDTQIAFGYQEGSGVPEFKLAVAPSSGGKLQHVARPPINARGLMWAPSGKALQYILTRNGASNIWEQPIAGGEPHQVTHFTSGLIFHGSWSRDGKELLLERGSESRDVILMSNFRQ
jgi:Tol biopolymer transport system component